MEVFEIRDQINDTSDAADLTRLHHNITEDIKQIETAFNSSVEAENKSRALLYAMRLKYYKKVGVEACCVSPRRAYYNVFAVTTLLLCRCIADEAS
jgi:predicted GH43/DUF377 family glycosyl hydrolase